MRILVVCQYYYPEPFAITSICESLVMRGHDITVVTGTPNYPMGNIYSGYKDKNKQNEIINGVKVHRCPIVPRKTGTIFRLLNYFSFVYQSKKYVKTLATDFDIVFINQLSPVFMAASGITFAKNHNLNSVLYCLDLWPASLKVGGIQKGIIYRFFYLVSKKIYRSVDKLLITSKSFSDYFYNEFDITSTTYLPQYAEDFFTPEDCKKKENDTVDLMFAGNIGTAQSISTIIKAASLCKDINNLKWHLIGDGKEIDKMKKMAEKLSAPVIFHGRKPIQEMSEYYSRADAMLVTLKKDFELNLTLPGKVQSYMAAGKPIIGAIDGEAKRVIEQAQCGFVCSAEDAQGLAKCVREFIELGFHERNKLGENGLEYYQANFTKKQFLDDLEKHLRMVAK